MLTANLDGNNIDDIVVDFGGVHNLYVKYNNETWARLHSLSPNIIAKGNIDAKGE